MIVPRATHGRTCSGSEVIVLVSNVKAWHLPRENYWTGSLVPSQTSQLIYSVLHPPSFPSFLLSSLSCLLFLFFLSPSFLFPFLLSLHTLYSLLPFIQLLLAFCHAWGVVSSAGYDAWVVSQHSLQYACTNQANKETNEPEYKWLRSALRSNHNYGQPLRDIRNFTWFICFDFSRQPWCHSFTLSKRKLTLERLMASPRSYNRCVAESSFITTVSVCLPSDRHSEEISKSLSGMRLGNVLFL